MLTACWFARRHYRKKKRAALHEAATTAGPLDWELEVDDITCAQKLITPCLQSPGEKYQIAFV